MASSILLTSLAIRDPTHGFWCRFQRRGSRTVETREALGRSSCIGKPLRCRLCPTMRSSLPHGLDCLAHHAERRLQAHGRAHHVRVKPVPRETRMDRQHGRGTLCRSGAEPLSSFAPRICWERYPSCADRRGHDQIAVRCRFDAFGAAPGMVATFSCPSLARLATSATANGTHAFRSSGGVRRLHILHRFAERAAFGARVQASCLQLQKFF